MAKCTNIWIGAALCGLAFALAMGCQSNQNANSSNKGAKTAKTTPPKTTASAPAKPKPGKAPTTPPPPSTNGLYSSQFDANYREVFELAEKRKWDSALIKAQELLQKNPDDESARRIYDWVVKQRQFTREKAIEDKIRDVESRNPDFNPTIPSLLTEKKDSGLPPRKDVRDAIQKIESEPYFPENFGRTIRRKNQLFDMESPQGRMSKLLDKEISAHLDNVSLEAIIFNIGQAEKINFVADKGLPAFRQTLSVNLQKVKLSEFLRYVARNMDVQFQVGEDLIWIVDAKDPRRIQEETRVFRLKNGFILPAQFGLQDVARTVTTVNNIVTVTEQQKWNRFVNDNTPTNPIIETVLKTFFVGTNALNSPKFLIDYERNLIVAKGTPDQMETIEKLIEEFDKPVKQVLIEARFVTITEAAFLQLGMTWESSGSKTPRSGQDFTDLGVFGVGQPDIGSGLQESFTNIFPKVLNRPGLTATLTALQQSGESQTLSAPRLTLINNLPAMINDGKVQYYYEEYTVKQTVMDRATASSLVPSGRPTKITSGVSLHVLASIGGEGDSILLALNPTVNQGVEMKSAIEMVDVNTVNNQKNTFVLKLPEYRTQELATRAIIKSGQTIVMGGVLEREQRKFMESVPVLGKLPIIGAAFRRRTQVDKPRYLLIFVTATVLNESGLLVVAEDVPASANVPPVVPPAPVTPAPAVQPPAAVEKQ